MAKKRVINNRNGNYSTEDWIRLAKDEDRFHEYMVKFDLTKSKCPPRDLLSDGACYYCVECQKDCAKSVKEYKNHYKVQGVKYTKEEVHGKDKGAK